MCSYAYFCFFFFKQKTAYEMRISDWSSDVCSSDLKYIVISCTSRKLQQVDGIGIHQVELAATFPLINPTGFQLGISYRCIRKSQFMTYQYFPGQIIQAQPANTRGCPAKVFIN